MTSEPAWVVLTLHTGPAVVGRVVAENLDGSWELAEVRIVGADGRLGEFVHEQLVLAPGRVHSIQRLRPGQRVVVGSGGSGGSGLAVADDAPRDPIHVFARFEPADILR